MCRWIFQSDSHDLVVPVDLGSDLLWPFSASSVLPWRQWWDSQAALGKTALTLSKNNNDWIQKLYVWRGCTCSIRYSTFLQQLWAGTHGALHIWLTEIVFSFTDSPRRQRRFFTLNKQTSSEQEQTPQLKNQMTSKQICTWCSLTNWARMNSCLSVLDGEVKTSGTVLWTGPFICNQVPFRWQSKPTLPGNWNRWSWGPNGPMVSSGHTVLGPVRQTITSAFISTHR